MHVFRQIITFSNTPTLSLANMEQTKHTTHIHIHVAKSMLGQNLRFHIMSSLLRQFYSPIKTHVFSFLLLSACQRHPTPHVAKATDAFTFCLGVRSLCRAWVTELGCWRTNHPIAKHNNGGLPITRGLFTQIIALEQQMLGQCQ